MKTTLPPPFAVYRCAGGFFNEEFVCEHYDPAEAIQACEDSMFIKAADGHAQKRLDAEKTHQIELLADQAKVTKKLMRAETDKNRKRELRVDLAKATRRTGILRMLIVRVDTTDAEQPLVAAAASVDTMDAEQTPMAAVPGVDTADAEQALVLAPVSVDTTDTEQAPVAAAAGVDITDAEQALPSRYKVYRRYVNDFEDEVLISEHFDPAEAISACGKEMFITVADGHSRRLLDAEKILQIRLLADQAEMIHDPLSEAQSNKKPQGKLLVSKLQANQAEVIQRIASLRDVQAFVDTNDAQQAPVVAAPSDDPEGARELTSAFFSAGDWFYNRLVMKDFRVGRPIMVLPSGTEEVIRNYVIVYRHRTPVNPGLGNSISRK
jgi:hypothetical protein